MVFKGFYHGSVPKQRLLQALFRIHRPIGVIKLDIIADNREFESLWGEKPFILILKKSDGRPYTGAD